MKLLQYSYLPANKSCVTVDDVYYLQLFWLNLDVFL